MTLKERRRLVLMVRETPFNLAHLRNMTAVTEMGGDRLPAAAGLLSPAATIDEMVDDTVERVLALLGVEARSAEALAGPVGGAAPRLSAARYSQRARAPPNTAFGYSGRPRLPL